MDEKLTNLTENSDLRLELLKECIRVIENSPKNHAYTTYDVDLVNFTIKRVLENFKNHFKL